MIGWQSSCRTGPSWRWRSLLWPRARLALRSNEAYRFEELYRYFADLRPRALIAQAGIDLRARRAALAHGIRVIELSVEGDQAAGLFALTGDQGSAPSDEPVEPRRRGAAAAHVRHDVAAEDRPADARQHLCVGLRSSAAALALRETDRCLNVLPLFHGHGLIATVLASLAAGASVVCTAGCDVNKSSRG